MQGIHVSLHLLTACYAGGTQSMQLGEQRNAASSATPTTRRKPMATRAGSSRRGKGLNAFWQAPADAQQAAAQKICRSRKSACRRIRQAQGVSEAVASNGSNPVDYLNRPVPPVREQWASSGWAAALERLKRVAAAPAGLLMVHLGSPWPPWMRFLLATAATNTLMTFYFLGPPLDTRPCRNCAWLPANASSVLRRIEAHLGLDGSRINLGHGKVADLKPMWPVLFPELTARHRWIGHADTDIIFGNLSDDIRRLEDDIDVLVPLDMFPQPIGNGNFLLKRTVPKLLHAFRRSPWWQQGIYTAEQTVFDEWPEILDHRRRGMRHVYMEMLVGGAQIRARPTLRSLVQDSVVVDRGDALFPTLDALGASVNVSWRAGVLTVERHGPCLCPTHPFLRFGLTVCAECAMRPTEGALLDVRTSRRIEAIGIHFIMWKKRWRRATFAPRRQRRRTHGDELAARVDPVPTCASYHRGFDLGPAGFTCLCRPPRQQRGQSCE